MRLNMDYLLKQMSRFLRTKIRLYGTDGKLQQSFSFREDLNDTPLFSSEVAQTLLTADSPIPLFLDINHLYSYASISNSESTLLVGPVSTESAYYFHTHFHMHLSEREQTVLSSHVRNVAWLNYLHSILVLANLSIEDTVDNQPISEISEYDVLQANCIPQDFERQVRQQLASTLFENSENKTFHNPYDQELRETSAIEHGDVDLLQKTWGEDFSHCGSLAADELRNCKNLAIVAITNASRAAIRGGVSPEVAFTLSDLYINQIEETHSDGIPFQLARKAEYEYTLLVKNGKGTPETTLASKENEHITNCKNYIFQHLHEHIYVREIADALNLNPSYLSDLFKKTEGLMLTEYILTQKLIRVKNLLIYSNYSYSEIAEYMGFASQSHLGKLFKENTGMTLKEYRIHYQMQEFVG